MTTGTDSDCVCAEVSSDVVSSMVLETVGGLGIRCGSMDLPLCRWVGGSELGEDEGPVWNRFGLCCSWVTLTWL